QRTQDNATERSREGLEEIGRQQVQTIANDQADISSYQLQWAADASQLAYRVTAKKFSEPITAGHFHIGKPGEAGPPDILLPAFDASGVITGTETLSPDQVLRLVGGGYYLNLHTASHGGGEIRGQVEPISTEARYSAVLTGSTGAGGFVRFKVRPVINVLDFNLAVTEIDNLTAAHIHKSPLGASNPAPAFSLYAASDGPFDPDHPASGALIFDALDLVDLITGFYYVNVHTTDFPAGEIRGQIGRVHAFTAYLDGGQEVPPKVSNAFGQGVFALNADGSQLVYRLFSHGLDDITLSHIHPGRPGINGPAEVTLFHGEGLFDDTHPISGTVTLTDAQVLKLASGLYYVNIHTASLNNAGLLRGQIEPFTPPTEFNALLNGANERPTPVDTDAAGVAHL
ncbi:MAG TPA: CHRD domain-containing protein, partial [Caldilineaceae bacterium]|nr:CHRD domain-containing protein [Caldilineaceae bacterium]